MHHKHIAFVGGGTAGHITPLLAVMESLERLAPAYGIALRGSFFGLQTDIKSDFMKDALPSWCNMYPVPAGKLHRHLSLDQFVQASRVGRGLIAANRLIHTLNPDALFAKGGYVSVPLVWAAHRARIPVYSHETDVIPGLANTWISKYADIIFTSYPAEHYARLPQDRVRYVGQPVRADFYTSESTSLIKLDGREVNPSEPLVTVTGGSQGAHRINNLVSSEWERFAQDTQLVHICGQREYVSLREQWTRLPEHSRNRIWLTPFIGKELPLLYKNSRVVISRAGGSISELAATGTPTILIPLSTAAQDHQWANARVLESTGAAVVMDEVKISSQDLFKEVSSLLHDSERRKKLSEGIRTYFRPDAADSIAEILLKRLSE